jgi:hypothetical protein
MSRMMQSRRIMVIDAPQGKTPRCRRPSAGHVARRRTAAARFPGCIKPAIDGRYRIGNARKPPHAKELMNERTDSPRTHGCANA